MSDSENFNSPKGEDLHVYTLATLQKHHSEVDGLYFSHDGRLLVSMDNESTFLWKEEAVGQWIPQRLPNILVQFLAFSLNGLYLYFLDTQGQIQIWTRDGRYMETVQTKLHGNAGYIFSPDQRWFITAENRQFHVWDTQDFQRETMIELDAKNMQNKDSHSWVGDFHFTPDGKYLAFQGLNQYSQINLCEVDLLKPDIQLISKVTHIPHQFLEISPNGQVLVASRADSGVDWVDVYQIPSLQHIVSLHMENDHPVFLAFSQDGTYLACAGSDGNVCIWSMQTYKKILSFLAHGGLWTHSAFAIGALSWSPRGDVIATSGASYFLQDPLHYDHSIKLWNISAI